MRDRAVLLLCPRELLLRAKGLVALVDEMVSGVRTGRELSPRTGIVMCGRRDALKRASKPTSFGLKHCQFVVECGDDISRALP